MTKQEILDHFKDIDVMYNDSSKHETLSRMLDELLKEQQPKKGYWKKPKNADARWHECSECGTMTRKVDEYGLTLICNYCPICGADMR